MTTYDILITTYTADPQVISAVTDFLTAHNYTYTIDVPTEASMHWAWMPMIGHDIEPEVIQAHLQQLSDVAVMPVIESEQECPVALKDAYVVHLGIDDASIETSLDVLHDKLKQAKRIVEKIKRLQSEIVAVKQLDTTPVRRAYIHDLETMCDYTQRWLIAPQLVNEDLEEHLLVGFQTQLETPQANEDSKTASVAGSPPQGAFGTFKGREQEVALLSDYLLQQPDIRLVSVLGKGGVGKTALTCNVLDTLSQHQAIDILIYLSAENRNQQFSLEQLFLKTGEAIGGETRDLLNRVWNNQQMMLSARVDYLIDEYVDRRVLILFDNLEDCLTDAGHFEDEGFAEFLGLFLERTHQATIVATSRIPLAIDDKASTSTRVIPLDLGLSEQFAIELLYEHDTDDCPIYADMPVDTLRQIVDLTNGYPRALEAITGIFFNDPNLTIEALLATEKPELDGSIVPYWVDKAEETLDADQRMVMQALAIFSRPVSETAVRFLLHPYMGLTALNVSFTLDRLKRGRFITVNQTTGDISMHPLDKAYNYDRIKEGGTDVGRISAGERFLRQMNILPPVAESAEETLFTRVALEKRAGDFYAQLRGNPADWKTIHDLQPYFLEYEHRLRAMDYETSFTMLITIYNLLKLSGFSRKIVEMILPLIDHLTDTYLMTCYNMLGMAFDDLGRYKDALVCHQKALPLAREEENRPAEAAHLSGIGLQYSNLGEYDRALDHYVQALAISRETGKRKQERGILNNMAVVYNSLGKKLEGLEYYEQSLEIAREIDDKQGAAVTLANIGDSYGALGKVEKTVDCYQESIEIYTEIGDKLGRGVTIGKMGNAAIMLGSYDDALKLLNVAVGIAQAVGNQMWDVLHRADMAAVFAHLGELEKGIDLLEHLIPQAQAVGSPILVNYTHSLLAGILLYDGQLERACNASETAIKHVNPANRHYEYALYGLILTRLDRMQDAQDAFNTALDHAAELLENTPDLYSPKYSRGLALMGLALVTDDMTYAEDAKLAYIDARKNCDAKGIITREMRKLKLLTGAIDDDDDDTPIFPPPNDDVDG